MNPFHDRYGRFSHDGTGKRAPAHQVARDKLATALKTGRKESKSLGIPVHSNYAVSRAKGLVDLTKSAPNKTAAQNYVTGFNRGTAAQSRYAAMATHANHAAIVPADRSSSPSFGKRAAPHSLSRAPAGQHSLATFGRRK